MRFFEYLVIFSHILESYDSKKDWTWMYITQFAYGAWRNCLSRQYFKVWFTLTIESRIFSFFQVDQNLRFYRGIHAKPSETIKSRRSVFHFIVLYRLCFDPKFRFIRCIAIFLVTEIIYMVRCNFVQIRLNAHPPYSFSTIDRCLDRQPRLTGFYLT